LRTSVKGAQVAEESSVVGAELEDRLVSTFSQHEREALNALLSKLVNGLLPPT
jgi:DNA-binding MarR family transcriptional regulator